MMRSGRELPELDVLRVVATLLVVAGHAVFADCWALDCGRAPLQDAILPGGGSFLQSPLYQGGLRATAWIYTFHMPLFFALSGVCYALSADHYRSLGQLCRRKLRRLMLPCLAAGLLYMIPLKYVCGFYTPQEARAAVPAFLSGVDTFTYGHLWFLPALFWVFLLFYLGYRAGGKRLGPVLAGAALLYGLGQPRLLGWLGRDVFYFSYALVHLLWFTLGYGFWTSRCRGWFERWPGWLGLGLGLLSVGGFAAGGLPAFLAAAAGALMCYAFSLWLSRLTLERQPVYRVLLRGSFYVYLLHDPLNGVVNMLTNHWQLLTKPGGVWLYQGGRFFGVIVVSVMLGAFWERLCCGAVSCWNWWRRAV